MRDRAAKNQETLWASHLVTMCQVGLVGYLVGGAFLSLAYFDLPYNLMVLILLARYWIEERERERSGLTAGRLVPAASGGLRGNPP